MRLWTGGGMIASAVNFLSINFGAARCRTRALAADLTASRNRSADSKSACRVSTRGFGKISTAPASNASNIRFDPCSVSVEQMIEWISGWIGIGGTMLNKPTHFEVRDGKF